MKEPFVQVILYGSLVEALTLDPARSRAAMIQNLLKVAVRCGSVELIDAQILQIDATGLFDRKLTIAGDQLNQYQARAHARAQLPAV